MERIKAYVQGHLIFSNDEEAFNLASKSNFGEKVGERVQYAHAEALYLLEKKRLEVYSKKKKLSFGELLNKIRKKDSSLSVKYAAYRGLRDKGYIVKTALKFGADFRVYNKGDKPGEKHARWLLYAVHESQKMTWHEFAAKNRVAHSTKKNLLIGIVDEESDVTYYEIQWIKA